jgi:hypothetical protein
MIDNDKLPYRIKIDIIYGRHICEKAFSYCLDTFDVRDESTWNVILDANYGEYEGFMIFAFANGEDAILIN